MKKHIDPVKESPDVKKGYNEKNPGHPEGAFPPDAHRQQSKEKTKSNTADKKAKEESN